MFVIGWIGAWSSRMPRFALFLAAWIDAICSASVDLSHHYALVFRFFDECP